MLRYQSSGQGVDAFCRGEAISKASFYRWRSIFGGGHDQEADVGKGTRSAFVDLGALNSGESEKPRLEIKLDLSNGLTLHLVRG